MQENDIQQNKAMAVFSYLGFLFLIPMLVVKDSPFTRFHVNQGILLFILELVLSVVSFVIGFIPLIGWVVSSITGLLALGLAIYGIMNVLQGRTARLPIIGGITLYS